MDDLISRQAAIEAFEKELTVGESKGNYVTICSAIGFKGIKRILEMLPSAEKHGRWIRTTKADYAWECSACGYGLCDNRTTYCYDCGARMERKEE